MKSFDTLAEAIDGLRAQGYIHDFNLHPEWIECPPPLNLRMRPPQFTVDQVHRFEGMSSTDDNAVVYAISGNGVKGILVDAYGIYAESMSPGMIDKLKVSYKG